MKTKDTSTRVQLLIDAYIEALVGVLALRLPEVQAIIQTHAPEMVIKSSYNGSHIILNASQISKECKLSGPTLVTAIEQITAAFVASMWDSLLSHTHYESIATRPEIQFFRHLRNACGHDGRWNFTSLKHLARWRDKELKLNDRGKPVFESILKHGDVLLLFLDIDRQHFESKSR